MCLTQNITFDYGASDYETGTTGCPKKKYSSLSLNNFKAIEAISLK